MTECYMNMFYVVWNMKDKGLENETSNLHGDFLLLMSDKDEMRIPLNSTSSAQEQRKRIVLLLIVHDATCTTAVNASFGKVVIIVQIPSDPSFIRYNLLSIYQLFSRTSVFPLCFPSY
jgi:hypothetical protein